MTITTSTVLRSSHLLQLNLRATTDPRHGVLRLVPGLWRRVTGNVQSRPLMNQERHVSDLHMLAKIEPEARVADLSLFQYHSVLVQLRIWRYGIQR